MLIVRRVREGPGGAFDASLEEFQDFGVYYIKGILFWVYVYVQFIFIFG